MQFPCCSILMNYFLSSFYHNFCIWNITNDISPRSGCPLLNPWRKGGLFKETILFQSMRMNLLLRSLTRNSTRMLKLKHCTMRCSYRNCYSFMLFPSNTLHQLFEHLLDWIDSLHRSDITTPTQILFHSSIVLEFIQNSANLPEASSAPSPLH